MKLAGTNGSYVSYHIIIRMVEMDIVFLIKLEEQCWDSSTVVLVFFFAKSEHLCTCYQLAPGVRPQVLDSGSTGRFLRCMEQSFQFPPGVR